MALSMVTGFIFGLNNLHQIQILTMVTYTLVVGRTDRCLEKACSNIETVQFMSLFFLIILP